MMQHKKERKEIKKKKNEKNKRKEQKGRVLSKILLLCLSCLVTRSIVSTASPSASNDDSNIEYAKQLKLVKSLSNQGLARQNVSFCVKRRFDGSRRPGKAQNTKERTKEKESKNFHVDP